MIFFHHSKKTRRNWKRLTVLHGMFMVMFVDGQVGQRWGCSKVMIKKKPSTCMCFQSFEICDLLVVIVGHALVWHTKILVSYCESSQSELAFLFTSCRFSYQPHMFRAMQSLVFILLYCVGALHPSRHYPGSSTLRVPGVLHVFPIHWPLHKFKIPSSLSYLSDRKPTPKS